MDNQCIHEAFVIQKQIQEVLGIKVGDNPEYFWKAIAGIHEEAEEAKKEDNRPKGLELNIPGYKFPEYINKEAKAEELADVFIQVVNACLFSDISAEELSNAIRYKTTTKLEKFAK